MAQLSGFLLIPLTTLHKYSDWPKLTEQKEPVEHKSPLPKMIPKKVKFADFFRALRFVIRIYQLCEQISLHRGYCSFDRKHYNSMVAPSPF